MELDDAKSLWQSLDQRLQQQNRLQVQLLTERRLDRMRGTLRPLFWGQIAQILFGCAFLLLMVAFWSNALLTPVTFAAGVLIHAYAVGLVIVSGIVLSQMGRIHYAAPVLEIQTQLARLRTFYIRSGMVAGLPWWFLWVPLIVVFAALGGVDLSVRAPETIAIGLGLGGLGLLGTRWFHRWARDPRRPDLARRVEDGLTGKSLRRAQAMLEEVKRFADE